MKKVLITLTILLFMASMSFSQIESDTTTTPQRASEKVKKQKKEPFSFNKIYFGGGVGFSFGSYTRIAVYPMLGYKFTPKLSGGIEVGYEYISDNRYASNYKTSNYGASAFARYRIIPQLYFHVEPAIYNFKYGYNTDDSNREWVKFLFVGGGYSQKIAPNTWAFAQVKFDVLRDSASPYSNWAPFWNVGVSIGF